MAGRRLLPEVNFSMKFISTWLVVFRPDLRQVLGLAPHRTSESRQASFCSWRGSKEASNCQGSILLLRSKWHQCCHTMSVGSRDMESHTPLLSVSVQHSGSGSAPRLCLSQLQRTPAPSELLSPSQGKGFSHLGSEDSAQSGVHSCPLVSS